MEGKPVIDFIHGNALYYKGLYKQSIKAYKRAIENHENEISALYNTAVCYIQLKKYKEAIPILKQAIAKGQKSNYFFNLAFCYLKLNDIKKALVYFNHAWALNPDDKECEKIINKLLSGYIK
jgi:tetratricopeptide (TPR) repeat protein